MAGFWTSFNQGIKQGQQIVDLYDKYALAKQIKEMNNTNPVGSFSQEDIDRINQAGGNANDGREWVSTNSEDNPLGINGGGSAGGGYWQLPDGSRVDAPNITTNGEGGYNLPNAKGGLDTVNKSQWTLGGITQNRQFSPEEVKAYRMNKIADYLEGTGDVEKAMQYRTQGIQQALLGTQLRKAQSEEEDSKAFKSWSTDAMKTRQGQNVATAKAIELYNSGDVNGAMKVMTEFYNSVPDGTHVFYDPKTGMGYVGSDQGLSQMQLNIHNPQTFKEILQAAGSQVDNHIQASMPVKDLNQYLAVRGDDREAKKLGWTMDMEGKKFKENIRQFGMTHGLEQEKIRDSRAHYERADANDRQKNGILASHYAAYNDTLRASKGITYDNDGNAYQLTSDPKNGGVRLTPVMLPDGKTQFKGSQKATGLNANKDLSERDKLNLSAYYNDLKTNYGDTPLTVSEQLDIAKKYNVTADMLGLQDPYAAIQAPDARVPKTKAIDNVINGKGVSVSSDGKVNVAPKASPFVDTDTALYPAYMKENSARHARGEQLLSFEDYKKQLAK